MPGTKSWLLLNVSTCVFVCVCVCVCMYVCMYEKKLTDFRQSVRRQNLEVDFLDDSTDSFSLKECEANGR